MYIDPNTGGMLFQILACTLVCAPIVIVIGIGGIVLYFVRKNKRNQKTDSTNSPNS